MRGEMCTTEDPDGLLEKARQVQDVRAGRVVAPESFLTEARRIGEEMAARRMAYTGGPKYFAHNGHVREAALPWLSDVEMAGKVRMLMRDDLAHEMMVCAARDRILHLSQTLEREQHDLCETLRAVLHFFGPEGANKVTSHVMKARDDRADNAIMDEIDAADMAQRATSRTLPVIGLNVQTDELDDGLGGEIG